MRHLVGIWCLIAFTVIPAGAQDMPGKSLGVVHAPRFRVARPSRASAEFDATYYRLHLRVQPDTRSIHGSVRVRGIAREVMSILDLDFDVTTLTVDSVVTRSGHGMRVEWQPDRLQVVLAPSVPAGGTVDLTVYYHGTPAPAELAGFVFSSLENGDPTVWSLSEPYGARSWWPSKDHPGDKADSVDVVLDVPMDLIAASNGLLQGVEDLGDGFHRFTWSHRYPIATYLVSAAIGRYDVDTQIYERPAGLAAELGPLSLPIVHYSFAGNGAFEGNHPQLGFRYITEIFPVIERWFGAYPFDREKYGHAQFTFGGGMEHQTLSSMSSNYRGLMAHELAHQWFGDMISPARWPHLWLNEGFATFGELAYWRASEFDEVYDQVFDIYYNRALTAQGTLVLQDTTDVRDMFAHARVYSKGWMVLRMLRGMMGDEVFRAILRSYAEDPEVRHRSAETADFRRVAEAVSGLDLGAFFRQWVTHGTGHPIYEVDWGWRELPGRHQITVTVHQTPSAQSNGRAFEMPLWLRIETDRGPEEILIHNNQSEQTYLLSTRGRPLSVELDPDRWVLRGQEIVVTSVDEIGPEPPPGFELFPNPAHGAITVSHAGYTGEAQIVDALGRVRATVVLGSAYRSLLDISELEAGMYGLRLVDGPTTTHVFTVGR